MVVVVVVVVVVVAEMVLVGPLGASHLRRQVCRRWSIQKKDVSSKSTPSSAERGSADITPAGEEVPGGGGADDDEEAGTLRGRIIMRPSLLPSCALSQFSLSSNS